MEAAPIFTEVLSCCPFTWNIVAKYMFQQSVRQCEGVLLIVSQLHLPLTQLSNTFFSYETFEKCSHLCISFNIQKKAPRKALLCPVTTYSLSWISSLYRTEPVRVSTLHLIVVLHLYSTLLTPRMITYRNWCSSTFVSFEETRWDCLRIVSSASVSL